MVFGQCLRALLEHQKNPKKTLQRHFQYSMLTRYLKPYMEANGDMTLIVNVSPCEEDYLDTAFVLRQAAPYSNIKLSLWPRTKDNLENLAVEKKTLPMKKRRKVDGSANASVNLSDCSKIAKTETREEVLNTMPDLCSDIQRSPEELHKCRSNVAGGIHGETKEDSEKPDQAILCANTTDELTATFLADVNNVLIREGVRSPDRVSLAVMEVFNTALKRYHGLEDIKGKWQQQHAEMTLLSMNLIKEQENAFSVAREHEILKKYCESLENQLLNLEKSSLSDDANHSRPWVSTKMHSPAEPNIKNIAGSGSETIECTVHDDDMDEPILVACASSLVTKNICDVDGDGSLGCTVFSADNNLDGQIKADAQSINYPNTRFSMVLSSMDTNCEKVRELEDLNLGKTVPAVNECTQAQVSDVCVKNTLVTLGAHNGQGKELQVCDSGGDFDLDASTIPFSEGVQCFSEGVPRLNSEPLSSSQVKTTEGQMACQLAFEVDKYHDQQRAHHESSQILQVNSLFPEISEVSEVADKGQVKFVKEAEKCTSPNMICQLASEVNKYHDQQRAHHESLQILQVNPLLPENLEVREVADKDQVKFVNEAEKCTSPSMTMLYRDYKLHSSNHETCRSEEYFQLEQDEKSFSPSVQDLLGLQEGQNTCSTHVEKVGSPQSYMEEVKPSNLQKGRLLALSLMHESKSPFETQIDHDPYSVHQPLNTPSSRGTIGPIGHDLEELLKIPLSELEKQLWSFEAATCSRGSDLLAKSNGLLETNNFPKKYSQQRANCIRYCLAVICGKMNVDGKCVPLKKETLAPRKRHFHAVIQARTVTEAAGHARAGFQVETLSVHNMTEMQRSEKTGAGGKASAQYGSLVKAHENKENRNGSSVSAKANAPLKRRRLQPLSSLSLQAGPHACPDLDSIEASAEEVYPSKSTLEGNTSKANSLAYLLTRHNH